MNKIIITLALMTLCLSASAKKDKKVKVVEEPVAEAAAPAIVLTTGEDSLAYCAGAVATRGLLDFAKKQFQLTDEQIPTFIEGFYATLKNDTTVTNIDKAMTFVNDFMQKKQEAYKNEQTAWLEQNKTKAGVITTPSGLQYKVIKEGNGPVAAADQEVVVRYEGSLIDGKVFDSSYKRTPDTTTFKPNQVIKGWTEALTMMPQGSVWELYIPQELGYGTRGAGNDILPFATLIFKVEVVEVKPATATAKDVDIKVEPVKTPAKTTPAKKPVAKKPAAKKK